MEKLVESWLAGESEVLGENLPQCHFVRQKPHMFCSEANPGRRGGNPATNRLNYGMALMVMMMMMMMMMTYLRSWALLQNLPIVQLLKNFPAF
jgi:hypothetical protein